MGILGTISGVLKSARAVNEIASRGPAHGYTTGTEYPVTLPGEGFEGHHPGNFRTPAFSDDVGISL